MTTDMPNEDELEDALLSVAREIGQCPHRENDGRQCVTVAGHTGEHYFQDFNRS